jgi:hypothetical protein
MAQCRKLYPKDSEGMSAAYKRMLRQKPDSTSEYVIRARVIVSEGETFHVVTCVEPSTPTASALYQPWAEWLAARVPASVKRKYPAAVFLAHCLRGMTMLGFSDAHMKRTLTRIDEGFRLEAEKARAEGFKPIGTDELFGYEPGKLTKPDAPKMTFSASFQESFSKIPPKDQKAIKGGDRSLEIP